MIPPRTAKSPGISTCSSRLYPWSLSQTISFSGSSSSPGLSVRMRCLSWSLLAAGEFAGDLDLLEPVVPVVAEPDDQLLRLQLVARLERADEVLELVLARD